MQFWSRPEGADVTASSGIRFEHRLSDWLARFIRGYTVLDGNVVRLAVPPAFGGSGVAAEDVDNDGDMDLVVGEYEGTLRAFRNDGGAFTALCDLREGTAELR